MWNPPKTLWGDEFKRLLLWGALGTSEGHVLQTISKQKSVYLKIWKVVKILGCLVWDESIDNGI